MLRSRVGTQTEGPVRSEDTTGRYWVLTTAVATRTRFRPYNVRRISAIWLIRKSSVFRMSLTRRVHGAKGPLIRVGFSVPNLAPVNFSTPLEQEVVRWSGPFVMSFSRQWGQRRADKLQ